MIVESMDKHLISFLGPYKLCSKRKHTMVLALLKFFSKLCAELCSFLKTTQLFLSMLFKKTKNTKQSPAVYILLMQHDIFFTLNYSLALINTTYKCHFTVNLGSTKAQSSKRRTRTKRVTFFPQDTEKVKID